MALVTQLSVIVLLFIFATALPTKNALRTTKEINNEEQPVPIPAVTDATAPDHKSLLHTLNKRSYTSPWNTPVESAYTKHSYYPSRTPLVPVVESDLPFNYYAGLKRSVPLYSFHDPYNFEGKRSPSEMGARGFHEGIFTHHFGDFSPVKRSKREDELHKRRPEMDSSGFYGDTFSNGFGDFYVMKKDPSSFQKRRPEWDSSGFNGDVFTGGFGDFYPMKKKSLEMDSSGFYGDTFSGGFGDFYTMKRNENPIRRKRETPSKRGPEMTSSGFFGDTFSNGFGDFYTMKRKPTMTSSGFHGDTFSSGFGDFYTMKKKIVQQNRLLKMLEALKNRMINEEKLKQLHER